MTKFTNIHNLPSSLYSLITRTSSKYSRGESDISVTQLIDSPKVKILKEKYQDEITEDISDMVWSFLGTAVHNAIEENDNDKNAITEKRLYGKIDGWVISGAIDRMVIIDDK